MPSKIEGSRGRVTLSIHIPMHQIEILNQAIALSGQSTSKYVSEAALRQAVADIDYDKATNNNGTA